MKENKILKDRLEQNNTFMGYKAASYSSTSSSTTANNNNLHMPEKECVLCLVAFHVVI